MTELSEDITIEGETEIALLKDSLWVTVGNVSVHVIKTDEGVLVDLWPLDHEQKDGFLLGATWINFAEAAMGDEEEADND